MIKAPLTKLVGLKNEDFDFFVNNGKPINK